jgi:DNA-binding CsgD family transcriptional regulator
VVVGRMADGVGSAAVQVRAVIDAYLDLCTAELSRIEDRHDPEPWARAAAVWDRRLQPYPAAYARLRQAEAALHRKSRKATTTALLRQAYATTTAMGARPLAAEIVGVAQRFKVALADDAATVLMTPPDLGPDDELGVLTTREREVLAAVAEGLTNREIGERLFISERTVGVHVGHIFDKLQVRTRVQASRVFLTAA